MGAGLSRTGLSSRSSGKLDAAAFDASAAPRNAAVTSIRGSGLPTDARSISEDVDGAFAEEFGADDFNDPCGLAAARTAAWPNVVPGGFVAIGGTGTPGPGCATTPGKVAAKLGGA